MEQNAFAVVTDPPFLPADEVERILSKLKNNDTTPSDLSQGSDNAIDFAPSNLRELSKSCRAPSNATSQQKQKQHARQEPQLAAAIDTDPPFLPPDEVEKILSGLTNDDTTPIAIYHESKNATFQQNKEQQPWHVRQAPQLVALLLSKERISTANGCVKETPVVVECGPSQGASCAAVPAFRKCNSHSQESYIYDHCEMNVSVPEELLKQTDKYVDDTPYKCQICQERFYYRSHFEWHLIVHSRPYHCEICGNTYEYSSYLTTHKRNKHPELNTDGENCSASKLS